MKLHFLDNLRAVAIIMVVGVHSMGYCLPLPDNQRQVLTFLFQICVPIFFMVDGYLFAVKPRQNYLATVGKSFNRLIIPWITFTLLYLFCRYAFEYAGLLDQHYVVGHSFNSIMVSSYGSVISSQMYFLVSLFFIRLATPLFRPLLNGHCTAVAAFVLYLAAYRSGIGHVSPFLAIEGGNEPLLHAFWGLQYYLLGILAGRLKGVRFSFTYYTLIISFCLLIGCGSQYFYLIIVFLIFTALNKEIFLLSILGRNTIGIYLIHVPIVMKVVSVAANKSFEVPVVGFLWILLATLLISSLVVWLINGTVFERLLFGSGRRFQLPRKTAAEGVVSV